MLTGRKVFSFLFVLIFTIFFNLILISNCKAAPLVINGSSQMSIGSSQTLSVSTGCGGPYIWSLSGGGTLSGTSGSSVTYTAPSSNSNCDNNPLISVTDSAGQKIYKQISVNGYYDLQKVAYKTFVNPVCKSYSGPIVNVYITVQSYNCLGNKIVDDCTTGHQLSFTNPPVTCERAYDVVGMTGCFFAGYTINRLLGMSPLDLRSAKDKLSGCCPAQFLSPPPPPVTVEQCTACDLKIVSFDGTDTIIDRSSGGKVTFKAGITSSKPFNWTFTVDGLSKQGSAAGSTTLEIPWIIKDQFKNLVNPITYTATLTVSPADGQCQPLPEPATRKVKITGREKDCKLDVTIDSSLNIASGNLSHSQNLFTVPNSNLMSDFTLYYNSMDGYDGLLGKGWTHNYNVFISTDPTDDAYILSDGRGGSISLYNNGSYYSSDISVYPMLRKNADNTFTLTYKSGVVDTFDTQGKLTAITDKNGNAVNLAYNSNGNLVSITDALGRIITLGYNVNNRISSITDPNNNFYTFNYSGNTLTQVSSQNALGTQNWRYTYDDKAFMLTKTDPRGNLVQYSYDADYRVSQTIDPQGGTISLQYDPDNNATTVTEKDGGIWVYRYDPVLGSLKSKTDPAGGTTSYEYDANRNLTSKIEADGSATTYTYDENGNMTSVTDGLGSTTTYTYNDQNLVTGITDATGRQTKYTYDVRGNILSTTDPSGAITQYAYDSKGNITSITNPNGGITTMAYDANNNLISVTDPGGQTTTQAYDNSGNMISQTDALGSKTTFQYNSLNQMIAVTDSEGKTTQYTYDAGGNRLSSTDANGNITRYDYNYKKQLIQTTDAAGFATTFTYGNGGCSSCGGGSDKLTAVTDAKNQTTSYQYDQTGRLIKETDPLGNVTSYTYDAKGNMISKTKPDGRIINYVYDDLNRLVERDYPNGASDVFQYDQAGNMTGATNQNIVYYYSYDANNRMTGVTSFNLAQIFNIEYQYDSMGSRKVMTFKEGTSSPRTINYEYNANNQLTKIISDTTGTYTFAYDALGRRIKRTLPNDTTTTYTYDQLSRLTNITHKNAFNLILDSFGYTHDNIGNRMTKSINEGIPHTISYNYDQNYRLIKAAPKSKNPLIQLMDDIMKLNTEAYSYDPVGNRQTGPKSNDSYTYDSGNELSTYKGQTIVKDNVQYEYDLNGNLVKKTETIQGLIKTTAVTTYTYDDENRLTDVTIQQGNKIKEVSFAYDPFGRRISRTLQRDDFVIDLLHKQTYPQTTSFVYDGQNIIAEYDNNNKQTASYIHGPNIDEPLSAEIRNNRIYYHADGLGSITALTNHMGVKIQQYHYDSFGNIQCLPFPIWITQPYTYTAREMDYETGLYYYRARYYDPKDGRFITIDPIGFEGGDANLYAYVGNNSINFVDPYGLKGFTPPNQKTILPLPSPFTTLTKYGWKAAICISKAEIIFFKCIFSCQGKSDCDKGKCISDCQDAFSNALVFECKISPCQPDPTVPKCGSCNIGGGGGGGGGFRLLVPERSFL